MAKYRRKALIVEAIQAIEAQPVTVNTGTVMANKGDWIVTCDKQREKLTPAEFEQRYENTRADAKQ